MSIDIKSLSLPELKEEMIKLGEKPFRAKQIYEWIHVKLVQDFDEMTNISKETRQKLKDNFELITLRVVDSLTSKDQDIKVFV